LIVGFIVKKEGKNHNMVFPYVGVAGQFSKFFLADLQEFAKVAGFF